MPLGIVANAKVPLVARKQYLNVFIDEYLKYCAPEEAFEKV